MLLLTQMKMVNDGDGSGFQLDVDHKYLPILYAPGETTDTEGLFIGMTVELVPALPSERVADLYDRGHAKGVLSQCMLALLHGTLGQIPDHSLTIGQPISLKWRSATDPGEMKECGTTGSAWGLPLQIIAHHPTGQPDRMAYTLNSLVLSATRTGRLIVASFQTTKLWRAGGGSVEECGYPAFSDFRGGDWNRCDAIDQLMRRITVIG